MAQELSERYQHDYYKAFNEEIWDQDGGMYLEWYSITDGECVGVS